MCDPYASLPARYSALFALRDARNVAAIATALRSPAAAHSAIFRHECAYVLGQLADEGAVAALCAAASDEAEHGMVRHEAAIALGGCGVPLGERIEGHGGMYWVTERPLTGAPVDLEVRVDDRPTDPTTYLWGPEPGTPGPVPRWYPAVPIMTVAQLAPLGSR